MPDNNPTPSSDRVDMILQLLQSPDLGGGSDPLTTLSIEDLPKGTPPKMKKPIMSQSVEADVLDALAQYANRPKWMEWGMHKLRQQGSAILLYGPTGTGKSTIAAWMSHKVGKGLKMANLAAIGGGDPGDSERGVIKLFTEAKDEGYQTICFDDCTSLLLDRESEDVESTWQLGTTETILTQISGYKGLVILCSNLLEKLDPALARRFLAIVEVGRPDHEMRMRLWKDKWPEEFPLQINTKERNQLASYNLSGAQIENVLMRVALRCIRKNLKPTMKLFTQFSELEEDKKIGDKK